MTEAPLRAIAVLVDVGRNRRDTRDAEVEGRDVEAELFEKWKHESSETRIRVEVDVSFRRECREIFDGVDDTKGITGRGARDHYRLVGDEIRGGVCVSAIVVAQWDLHRLDVEVGARFGEGGMGRVGEQHLRPCDASFLAGPISRRLGGHDDALGPAGSHGPGRALATMEQLGRHRDDVDFHAAKARKPEGVEGVFIEVEEVGLAQQSVDVLSSRINEAPGASLTPIGVRLLDLAHTTDDVLLGRSLLG